MTTRTRMPFAAVYRICQGLLDLFSDAKMLSAMVRFFCHVPFSLQAWNALDQYNLVRRTPELRNFASKPILRTKRLAAVAGMFGFAYNAVLWVLAPRCPTEFFWIFGIIDLAITICLAVAAGQQAGFTLKSKAICSGDLSTWILEEGKGLFEVVAAARHNATATARKECEDWHLEWTYEIVLV